jgi:hypothetical protein
MLDSNIPIRRDKAVRLFTYLRELVSLRSTLIREYLPGDRIFWLHRLPVKPANEAQCYTAVWGVSEDAEDRVWIELKKTEEPTCPGVPFPCEPWVSKPSLLESASLPYLNQTVPAGPPPGAGDAPRLEERLALENYSEVLPLWDHYLQAKWGPWAELHERWKRVDRAYSELFEIYQNYKRQRETYELVLGLGLLSWSVGPRERVFRHVLTAQADLTFDPDSGILTVGAAADGAKLALELDMLAPGERPLPELMSETQARVAEASDSPWDRSLVDPILRGWVHGLDPTGRFDSSLIPPSSSAQRPTIHFAPALVLRRRTARNMVQTMSSIIQQLEDGQALSGGLASLCENLPEDPASGPDSDRSARSGPLEGPGTEIFFPREANDEQRRIVEALMSRKGVVVQGPPGTGKSHTIANLICHLLATGKRLLVTSQTPRALKVLKGKIPTELQPLCVSLLGNDAGALRDLESSVLGITDRFNEWDPGETERAIESDQEGVTRLRSRKAALEAELRHLRERETHVHTICSGAYSGTAAQIARRLREEARSFGWFPDQLCEQMGPALSQDEIGRLLLGYRRLTPERCQALQRPFIKSRLLPTVEDFVGLADQEARSRKALAPLRERLGRQACLAIRRVRAEIRDQAAQRVLATRGAIASLASGRGWKEQAIRDVLSHQSAPWEALREKIEGLLNKLGARIPSDLERQCELPAGVDRRKLHADLEDLLRHLKGGGKKGWWIFRSGVVRRGHYLLRDARVKGRPCQTLEALGSLLKVVQVEEAFEELWHAWSPHVGRSSGPWAHQIAALQSLERALSQILELTASVEASEAALRAIPGIPRPSWTEDREVSELLMNLRAVQLEADGAAVQRRIEPSLLALKALVASPHSHPINRAMLEAIDRRDAAALGEALRTLERLEGDMELLADGQALSERLQACAPKLNAALAEDPDADHWNLELAHIEGAWAWARACGWLRDFRLQSGPDLERELHEVNGEIRRSLGRLASRQGWLHCFRRMTEEQRKHLVAWKLAVKKIGKGTGKHAEKHRSEARVHMEACRSAIPAWIMPLYRLVETVEPKPELFDVVIVDEASQCGPEALLLFHLAKKLIIVGDDQQISPDAVGVDQGDVDSLTQQYVPDFDFKDMLGPDNSLFAQAMIHFGGRIVLREHFRCMPEIIRFSNELCYRSTPLHPLRQYPPGRLEPIVGHHVPEGRKEGTASSSTNLPEAETLARVLVECCGRPDYRGKTMGVVSLLGEEQAHLIQRLLIERLGPEEMERRELICGDAYAFQGDERDVMFLSVVAAPNQHIGALTKESDKRRFNVAVSRARDQVCVFHSVTLGDLNPEDMRAHLLRHCQRPPNPRFVQPDWSKCESELEIEVGQNLFSRGFRAIPQFEPFGPEGRRLDWVVEGGEKRLAVECYGDSWQGPEQYGREAARQRDLERCGWTFHIVQASEFFFDPERTLESLWRRLRDLHIYPWKEGMVEGPSSKASPPGGEAPGAPLGPDSAGSKPWIRAFEAG